MFTSQKTFGVNLYFSAPGGASRAGVDKTPETLESPLKSMSFEDLQKLQADLIKKGDKTPEEKSTLEAVNAELERRGQEAKTQAQYSANKTMTAIGSDPNATPKQQWDAIQKIQ